VYSNKRLISRATTGVYHGVTHEYLDAPGDVPLPGIWFKDHQDGENRKDKFKRDILLLLTALKKDPDNARYHFYLANSYRDAGKLEDAIFYYKSRIGLGGWDQEVWNAQYKMALCYKALGQEAEFIRNMLIAYNQRPSRAEALYELALYYRMSGMQAASVVFSELGMTIPYSDDALFVVDHNYKVGLREEFSICAFYDTARRQRGFEVCNGLALDKTEYAGARDLARKNLFHYLKPLVELAPSFVPKQLTFAPEGGWKTLNPSVANVGGKLSCVIRSVNYMMDEQGRYCVLNAKGELQYGTQAYWENNPIITRNYLASLSKELDIQTVSEILPPPLPAPAYPLVRGFEDMRLFEYQGDMWTSSTVRELNKEGWCEQVLAKIDRSTKQPHIVEWSQMLPAKRQHEKNWMPWVIPGTLRFAYRLNETVNSYGQPAAKTPLAFAADHMSGGSQVIPFNGGWLALVHEAGQLPDTQKRYYQHRFVWFNPNGVVKSLSLPFVFHSKQIEFAAGLARHPDDKRLVISYGIADKEAWVATVTSHDVMELLHL
jgi:tetratricopeptide (TPR) repeat protein